MSCRFLLLSSTLTLILAERSFAWRNNVSVAPNADVPLIQLQGRKGLLSFLDLLDAVLQDADAVDGEGCTCWPSLSESRIQL